MLFTEFLPTPNNLKLRQIPMLALPGMSMQRKALALRVRNPRKHAHLNNNHRREDLSDRHDRTTTALVSLQTLHAGARKLGGAYFPQFPQKHLSTFFPLPVSQSSYFFITPFGSSTTTFSFSMARFDDTYEPATLRQLAQWHRCPRGRVKSSLSLMVTRIDLHRQVELKESENFERSCELGSPVSLEGSAIVNSSQLWTEDWCSDVQSRKEGGWKNERAKLRSSGTDIISKRKRTAGRELNLGYRCHRADQCGSRSSFACGMGALVRLT